MGTQLEPCKAHTQQRGLAAAAATDTQLDEMTGTAFDS
jgi:hypothetical protein